jgi:Na+-transporting NADH:ubiquinone oxidoreductase subunit D
VDIVLKAYVYDVSKQVGVYVGLIITNCILMGRYEAFAMGNKVWPSALDGLGNSLGYAWILVVVGVVRELTGSGSIMGLRIIPESWYATEGGFYFNNNMMILPPMALIIVGIIIWIQRSRNTKLIEQA